MGVWCESGFIFSGSDAIFEMSSDKIVDLLNLSVVKENAHAR